MFNISAMAESARSGIFTIRSFIVGVIGIRGIRIGILAAVFGMAIGRYCRIIGLFIGYFAGDAE